VSHYGLRYFYSFENLTGDEDVVRAWENIKEEVKLSATESLGLSELKQYKLWLGGECSGSLDQHKYDRMQLLQDTSQRNVNNVNNARRDASRHFRNKIKEYPTPKIDEYETP